MVASASALVLGLGMTAAANHSTADFTAARLVLGYSDAKIRTHVVIIMFSSKISTSSPIVDQAALSKPIGPNVGSRIPLRDLVALSPSQ